MPARPVNEEILGRKNCLKCGRWRIVAIDFPVRVYHAKGGDVERILAVCRVCRNRESTKSYQSLSPEAKRARWMKINAQRQEKVRKVNEAEQARRATAREINGFRNGRLLTVVPFRMWLIKKLKVYGSVQRLVDVTGVGHTELTRYLKGYDWNESLACDPRPVLTVPASIVDRALLNEGSDSLRGIGYE